MKKFFLLMTILILFILVGCKPKKPNPVDTPPTPEVVVSSLLILDNKGNSLDQVSVYQSKEEYTHEGIYVWAVFSDSSRKDVTTEATFSEVDLSIIEIVEVKVTYKEVSTTYELIILDPSIKEIAVDLSNSTLVYPINSTLNPKDIQVIGFDKNSNEREVSSYIIGLYNSMDIKCNISEPLTVSGYYRIVITYADLSTSYDIYVYDGKYLSESKFKADLLVDKVTLSEDGSHTFISSYVAHYDQLASLSISGTLLETRNSKNNEGVFVEYESEIYRSYIHLNKDSSFKLNLYYPVDIFMVVGNFISQDAKITFIKDGLEIEALGYANAKPSTAFISLDAGDYEIHVNSAGVILYGMTFFSNVVLPEFTVDTTNAQTTYVVGDTFSIDGVSGYLIWENDKILVPSEGLSYRLFYNKKEVKTLDYAGEYEVYISFESNTAIYTIEAQNSKTKYQKLELDLTEAVTSFEGTKFSLDGLRVYGVLGGTKELLGKSEYQYSLGYDGTPVTQFNESGKYEVKITYLDRDSLEELHATYEVVYYKKYLTFRYSGFGVPQDVFIYPLLQTIEYTDYIQVPNDSYVFLGFGVFDYTKDDEIEIKVAKVTEGVTYAYVTPRYEYIEHGYSAFNPNPNHLLRENEIFDNYILDTERSNDHYRLYVAKCITPTARPIITKLSENEIKLEVLASIALKNISVSAKMISSTGDTINLTEQNMDSLQVERDKKYVIYGTITGTYLGRTISIAITETEFNIESFSIS